MIRLTQDCHIKRAISYQKFANEISAENSDYLCPVPQSQFNAIWARNKDVIYATAYNLKFS
ncbi:MAG: hypothetical protein IJ774_13060 [Selenomonadaceae bacterium]|nr:hypothetical protein [Selenomonadaceae bacterium]